eukprot:864699-Prorocentrum_minimum.AAC.2
MSNLFGIQGINITTEELLHELQQIALAEEHKTSKRLAKEVEYFRLSMLVEEAKKIQERQNRDHDAHFPTADSKIGLAATKWKEQNIKMLNALPAMEKQYVNGPQLTYNNL